MVEFLAMASFCMIVPLLVLLVVTRFEPADEERVHTIRVTGWDLLDQALSRLRFWPAVVVCGLSALIFIGAASHDPEPAMVLALILIGVLFFRAWRHEFVTLMGCDENAFAGRFDKLIWVALMVLVPPIGYTCFRAYRRTLQPVAEAATPHAKPMAAHAHDLS